MVPLLELHKLPWANQIINSKTSTVIAISGFMSKNTDKNKEWLQLTNYFSQERLYSNTFALNWEAKSIKEIWKEQGKNFAKGMVSGGGIGMIAAKKMTGAGAALAGLTAASKVY